MKFEDAMLTAFAKIVHVLCGFLLPKLLLWKGNNSTSKNDRIPDSTCREQFLVPLPLYHPVFTIVIYG